MDSCGEYFPFYGLAKFLNIYISGLKAWGLLVQDSISLLYPESWHWIRPICSQQSLSEKLIFLFPIFADGRRCHPLFRVLANHLASTFFLPLSGDSLGLLYPILYPSGHQVQTSVCFHSDLDLLHQE